MSASASTRLEVVSAERAVVGVRDRTTNWVTAQVARHADPYTPQGSLAEQAREDTEFHTDDARADRRQRRRPTVTHAVRECLTGHLHADGGESVWSMLGGPRRAALRRIGPKHFQRYVDEAAGCYTIRELDTIDQVAPVTEGRVREPLRCRDRVRPNRPSRLAHGASR